MSATLTIISWRDIPAQVIARNGRTAARVELPPRFQVAIDRAAMEAGLIGSDAYLEQWRRAPRECGDDLDGAAAGEAERIDREYDSRRLARLVAAFGHEETQ